jgi:hypothetical protein
MLGMVRSSDKNTAVAFHKTALVQPCGNTTTQFAYLCELVNKIDAASQHPIMACGTPLQVFQHLVHACLAWLWLQHADNETR